MVKVGPPWFCVCLNFPVAMDGVHPVRLGLQLRGRALALQAGGFNPQPLPRKRLMNAYFSFQVLILLYPKFFMQRFHWPFSVSFLTFSLNSGLFHMNLWMHSLHTVQLNVTCSQRVPFELVAQQGALLTLFNSLNCLRLLLQLIMSSM